MLPRFSPFLAFLLLATGYAAGCRPRSEDPLLSKGTPDDPVFTPTSIANTSYIAAKITAGLDPNLYNDSPTNQDSLLHYAVRHNAEATVAMLLDRGADIEIRSQGANKTPLFFAAFGHPAIVKLLISRGADIQAVDLLGNNALREAIAAGEADIVKSLLDAGADPLHHNTDGISMLDLAEKHGTAKIKSLMRDAADRRKPSASSS